MSSGDDDDLPPMPPTIHDVPEDAPAAALAHTTSNTGSDGFGANVEFVDELPDEYEIDEVVAARTRRWTTRTILFATLLLALLNAASLRSWASTLPPDWGTETIRQFSTVWYDQTAKLGLDQPRAQIRAAWEDLQTWTWGLPASKPAPEKKAPAP